MHSIDDFVKYNYDLVFPEKSEGLEGINEFYLADKHNCFGYQEINSLFINTFAGEGDLVLIEGSMANIGISVEQNDLSVWLKPSISVKGWDIIDEDASDVPKKITEVNIKIKRLVGQIVHCKDREEIARLKKELGKAKDEEAIIAADLYMDCDSKEKLSDTFQKRQLSLQHTTESVVATARRIFIIAGQAHFMPYEGIMDPRMSVSSFQEFVRERNAAILVPKKDKVCELGEKYEAVYRETPSECVIC